MKHPMRLIPVLAFGLVLSQPALANDSTAELATGGLIFVQNPDVEMRSEDLYISTSEIRVRYRFFNKSDRDITVPVAFPMPEIRIEHQDQNISVPTEDGVNLLDFVTQVDGGRVETKVEQRVFSGGIDRTQFLRERGIPFAPHLRSTNDALDRLPRARWDELTRVGLAEIEEFDEGKGMQKHLSARRGLQTTFYWEQTFPSRREIVIEHRYKPSVGGTVGTGFGAAGATKEDWFPNYRKKYCIDAAFIAATERARKAARGADSAPYFEERIDYILKTGANWSGPIGDFRLVVDKGSPDALVSFCGDGVKKISPTQFEVRKKDFVPEGNLSVLILKKPQL
jgi:hypothetical protein